MVLSQVTNSTYKIERTSRKKSPKFLSWFNNGFVIFFFHITIQLIFLNTIIVDLYFNMITKAGHVY